MREAVIFGFVLLTSVLVLAVSEEDKSSEEDEKGCSCHFNYPKALGQGSRSSSGGRYSSRVEALEKRIAHVAAEVIDIQRYWESTVVPEREQFREKTKSLLTRVEKLEGTGCEENHFQCGGDAPQCISNLFVCDGSTECYNGYDEDEKICKTLVASGTVFKGDLLGEDQCTGKTPKDIKLVVGSATRYTWFRSRAKLTASLIFEFENEGTEQTEFLPCTGYYDFASRSLVLTSKDDSRYGLSCTFDKYQDNTCEGSVHHIYTKETCAKFRMHREKADTD